MISLIQEICWGDAPIVCVGRSFRDDGSEIGSVVRARPFDRLLHNSGDSYKVPDEALGTAALLRRHWRPFDMKKVVIYDGSRPKDGRSFTVAGRLVQLPDTCSASDMLHRLAVSVSSLTDAVAASTGVICRVRYKNKPPEIEVPEWVEIWRWPEQITVREVWRSKDMPAATATVVQPAPPRSTSRKKKR